MKHRTLPSKTPKFLSQKDFFGKHMSLQVFEFQFQTSIQTASLKDLMIDQNLLFCKSLGAFDAGFFVLQYIEDLWGLTCTTCHTMPTCTILTDISSFWQRGTESTLSKKAFS